MKLAKTSLNSFKLANLLFAIAIFIRVIIPQGYMANNSNTDGLFPIILCTAQGNVEAFIDNTGQITEKSDAHSNENHKDRNHCSFAGSLNSFSYTPNFNLSINEGLDFTYIIKPKFEIGIGYGLAAPPPPSTGPPLNA